MGFKDFKKNRKPTVQAFENQKVNIYTSKIDYFKYTNVLEEVNTLKRCEEKIVYTTGKIDELNLARWEAFMTMRSILKKDGEFGEVMSSLGISKDMVYEIKLREKLFVKYDVDKKDIAALPVRAVKALAKENLSHARVAEIVKEPAKLKNYIKSFTPKKDKAISIQEELENLEREKETLLKKKAEINKRLQQIDARIAVIKR